MRGAAARAATGYSARGRLITSSLSGTRRKWGFSLNEVKELLALRQKPHACSEVQSMLNRKLPDVREKIKILARVEVELSGALSGCNRELRARREVKHDGCCPLLSRLDRNNLARGKRK